MNKLLINSLQQDRNMNSYSAGVQPKKQGLPYFAAQPESLLGMAMYDFDTVANDTGLYGNNYSMGSRQQASNNMGLAPAFHPVDEYKDLSLKEILDLSDDFLAPEDDTLLGNSQEYFEPTPVHSFQQPQLFQQQQQQMHMMQQQQRQMQLIKQQQQMNLMTRNMNLLLPNQLAGNMPTFGPSTPRVVSINAHEDLASAMNNSFFNEDSPDNNFVPSAEELFPDDQGVVAPPTTMSSCNKTKKRTYECAVSDSDEYDEGCDEDDMDYDGEDRDRRFRPYQAGQWSEKFEELCAYREQMGHCLVPHTFTENLALARWVKRQRYQYKLMVEGKSSTMTEDRVKALEEIGFVWDSQGAAWGDRLHELQMFKREFEHCNVPSNYCENPRLATWIKCQRRQYKLYMEKKPSNMTPQRIHELEKLGFEWELRSYKKTRTA